MNRPKRDYISSKSLTLIGIPDNAQTININNLIIPSKKYGEVVSFVKEYINRIRNTKLSELKGLCFMGSNGVGKTLMSCLILKEAYKWRYTCKRMTFVQYVSVYTNAWGSSDYSDIVQSSLLLESIKETEFLLLEEIGKEIDSKISAPILEDLLRYREDKGLVTIICTNLSTENLKLKYGESIMSLIAGATDRIVLTGVDFRKALNTDIGGKL